MEDRVVQEIMTGVNCSVCGQNYQAGNIKILYHEQDLWFIRVFCQSCRTRGLVAALIKEAGEARIVSDLTEDEMARFMEAPPVTGDDLLDVHSFLDNFDGDFASLFGKDSGT